MRQVHAPKPSRRCALSLTEPGDDNTNSRSSIDEMTISCQRRQSEHCHVEVFEIDEGPLAAHRKITLGLKPWPGPHSDRSHLRRPGSVRRMRAAITTACRRRFVVGIMVCCVLRACGYVCDDGCAVGWPALGSPPSTANRQPLSRQRVPQSLSPRMPWSHAADEARHGVPRVPITHTLASNLVICRAFDLYILRNLS